MKSRHVSETPATQFLKRHGVTFEAHTYDYVPHGGTAEASRQLGAAPHAVIKTLVFEDEKAQPLIILMHGDCEVSAKNLARQIGVRKTAPCTPEVAQRHSGYLVGGTSPFGTRKRMPVWVQRSILDLPKIWINGGQRGYLLSLDPQVLTTVLQAKPVDAALEHGEN